MRKRAERLMGYEIRELPPERGQVALGAFDGTTLIEKAVGRAEWIALKGLVNRVLMLHSRRVLENHGYRCARAGLGVSCRSITENIARTVERTKVENLEPVCWDCHRAVHRLERSQ